MSQHRRPQFGLWIILAAIALLVLALAIAGRDGFILGFESDEFGELGYLLLILVLVGSALIGHALRPWQILRGIVLWALAFLVIIGVYSYRTELAGVGGRLLGALAPGVPVVGILTGDAETDAVVINRGRNGHFAIRGEIDDQPVTMLVDTGASFVTLTSRDAHALGFDVASLDFDLPIRTANGELRAAPITVEKMTIGTIERRDLRALVAPPRTLSQSLLGLSFLDTLSGYTVAGDRLVLAP